MLKKLFNRLRGRHSDGTRHVWGVEYQRKSYGTGWCCEVRQLCEQCKSTRYVKSLDHDWRHVRRPSLKAKLDLCGHFYCIGSWSKCRRCGDFKHDSGLGLMGKI